MPNTLPGLVLIEGIMGAGKTSTAQFVERELQRLGAGTELYLEGNLSHPADYDGVSLDTHKAILLERWQRFGAHQLGRGKGCKTTSYISPDTTSYIFDCTFLQNPVCKFIAMHNAGQDILEEHILKMAEAIVPLRPILIYLYPTNVRETLERVIPQRPKEWLDAVIEYHTGQEYGKAHHLKGKGLDGLIEFLERRQEIEMEVCTRLPFPVKIVIDPHEDWDEAKREMSQFIAEVY